MLLLGVTWMNPSFLQASHDQAVRLNRVCEAAFPLPKHFVKTVPWGRGIAGVGR